MKKVISKKMLVLLSLLLFLPLFSGCFLTPSVNQTPTITSTSITTATVKELYVYSVNATDPDGDTLTYSLTTHPSGMTINSTTGLINWTPTSAQIGNHNVTVEVSDGEKSTTQSFTITVSKAPIIPPYSPTNHAPIITSTPITTATVDEPYTYDVNATDSDGDTLTYSFFQNPTDMTIDSTTGLINWTPTSTHIGDNIVTVEVSDGEKSTTQSFIIKVYDILTSITVLPATMTLFVRQDDLITSITASYTYGPNKAIALADCTYGSDDEAVATVALGVVTGVAAGSATITVSYTEGGITKTDTVAVTVNTNEVTSITVLPATMTLFVGEDDTITSIMASYNYGPDLSIALAACTYGSDDEAVATVAVGVVTTVDPGTATITVTYIEGGITETDTVLVTVNPIPNLELTPPTQSVTVGNQATVNILVEEVTNLRGANITLNFDASKLQYNSSSDGDFIPNDFLAPATVDNVGGSITLDIAGLGVSGYHSGTGTGTIITIVFDTIATASPTNITFGTTNLRDKDNITIIHTKGSGCSVTITTG